MTNSAEAAAGSRQPAFSERLRPAPVGGGFAMPGYWVWCGSAIRGDDGQYHLFASRWPHTTPFFAGYQVASEIVRAVSPTPAGPYHFQEVVLGDRGSQYWDGRMTHNPTIHRWGDTYLLYYIGGTFAGPRPAPEDYRQGAPPQCAQCYATIRIGLATAKSVLGPWTRCAEPILQPRPGQWDSTVVTNPAPCILDDGSVLLLYRSNTPAGLRIGAAMAEHFTAPLVRISDEPVLRLDDGNHVEDPFVWWNGERFECLAKDMTGGLTGEVHAGVHLYSGDGCHWQVAAAPKAYSRRIVWNDGTVTVQGCLERPQLLIEHGQPTHLFAATADGPGGFHHASTTWTVAIPLRQTREEQ